MSLSHEYTDNFFIGESSILDAHVRLFFRAYHYETPCRASAFIGRHRFLSSTHIQASGPWLAVCPGWWSEPFPSEFGD